MEKMEKKIQEVVFDVEVQYCDPSDCYHDCKHEGVNNCDAYMTTIYADCRCSSIISNYEWKNYRILF